MKNAIFLVAGFLAFVAVGSALAGSTPQTVTVKKGCHGREYVMEAQDSCGCHGQLLAPAYADGGCHGGRLALSERRTARNAARANYRTTLNQFRDAGRSGADLQAVPVSNLPTMKMVPVEVESCKCKCNPCACK